MINELKLKHYRLIIQILMCFVLLLYLTTVYYEHKINESNAVIERQEKDILNQASIIEALNEQITQHVEQNEQQQLIINGLHPEFLSHIPDTWPIKDVPISSYFGRRTTPAPGFHSAIDFDGSYGDLIYAAGSGTVIEAGWYDSYGYKLTIDHGNGYKTVYAHCSKLLVEVGQEVTKSEEIAYVGATGYATGPHLHFELLYNNVKMDPFSVVINKLESTE